VGGDTDCVGHRLGGTGVNTQHGQRRGMIFIFASVVLSACAQLFLKAGMLEVAMHDLPRHLANMAGHWPLFLPAISWLGLGLLCYAVSMLFWMAALAKYELSLAYPMLSLSYVLVYFVAVAWPRLGESVSMSKTMGIVFIVAGVILVTYSARQTRPRTAA